jgi:hypothetical protein
MHEFPLSLISTRSLLIIAAFVFFIPFSVLGVLAISSPWSSLLKVTTPIVGTLLIVAASLGFQIAFSRMATSPDNIVVRAGFYRAEISRAEMVTVASEIDLETEQSFSGLVRTNGLSVPGYNAGWFVSKGGRKVFLATGKNKRVVLIRSSGPFDMVLGGDEPSTLAARINVGRARVSVPSTRSVLQGARISRTCL